MDNRSTDLCACGHHDRYHFADGTGYIRCRATADCACVSREAVTSKTVDIRAEIREMREFARALPGYSSMTLLEVIQRIEDAVHPADAPPSRTAVGVVCVRCWKTPAEHDGGFCVGGIGDRFTPETECNQIHLGDNVLFRDAGGYLVESMVASDQTILVGLRHESGGHIECYVTEIRRAEKTSGERPSKEQALAQWIKTCQWGDLKDAFNAGWEARGAADVFGKHE